MCKRNVQTGCTGYVHIAAMRMIENDGCFLQLIKLSPVDVMRLSLGAWWPEDRSSSSVSQFLPSRFWSALPDGSRVKRWVTGVIWVLDYFCSSAFAAYWGRCPAERGGQTLRCAQLSASSWRQEVTYILDGLRVSKLTAIFPFWVNYPFIIWCQTCTQNSS